MYREEWVPDANPFAAVECGAIRATGNGWRGAAVNIRERRRLLDHRAVEA